jgi:hypothetical protein
VGEEHLSMVTISRERKMCLKIIVGSKYYFLLPRFSITGTSGIVRQIVIIKDDLR